MYKRPGIYAIRCMLNDMRYVGSASRSIRQRWNEHLSDLRRLDHCNQRLQRTWNKYGADSFVFEVLEFVDNPDLLLEREQYWIDVYWGRDTCYNTAPVAGSCIGVKHTTKTKQILKQTRLELMRGARRDIILERYKASMEGKWSGWPTNASARGHESRRSRRGDYVFVDSSGQIYHVSDVATFCRDRELSLTDMVKVGKGKRKSCKGWRRYEST